MAPLGGAPASDGAVCLTQIRAAYHLHAMTRLWFSTFAIAVAVAATMASASCGGDDDDDNTGAQGAAGKGGAGGVGGKGGGAGTGGNAGTGGTGGNAGTGGASGAAGSGGGGQPKVTFVDVDAKLDCVGCHSKPGPEADFLFDYESIVNGTPTSDCATYPKFVDLDNPEKSFIYAKIAAPNDAPLSGGCGEKMPLGAVDGLPEEAEVVLQWIKDGALEK